MKYKIEIWQWHNLTTAYESDDIKNILKWYRRKWLRCYECGGCSFDIYRDGELLEFDEEYELGFYD